MVGEETCVPSQGVGGNGIASEFGDLTGMTRQEVDDFLRGLGAEIRTTKGGYLEYEFAIVREFIFVLMVKLYAPQLHNTLQMAEE